GRWIFAAGEKTEGVHPVFSLIDVNSLSHGYRRASSLKREPFLSLGQFLTKVKSRRKSDGFFAS
ncbi:MAG: hypothetical protein IIX28_03485, partial [Clostridia bacterium]|nr:hypothetical protein [Clostridia bacterium]